MLPAKNFFVDEAARISLTYQDILDHLATTNNFSPVFFEDDLKGYFLNFITGIIHNQAITLVDLGISEEALKALTSDSPETVEVKPTKFESVSELLEAILKSTATLKLFTSGTTGRPKDVQHKVSRFLKQTRVGTAYKEHVWGMAYNPTHMAGLQVIFQALANGSSLINLFNKEKSFIHKQIRSLYITHLSATPTFFRMLFPSEAPFEEVKRITLGGEKSDQHLINRLQALFPNAKINNIYASSEAGTILVSKQDYFEIPVQLEKWVRVNEAKELEIHHSLLGKVASNEENSAAEEWYKTGDIVNFVDDSKRRFTFAGRKKEMLNIGGNKVNPNKVAELIMQHPAVKNALVYGKANSVLGTILRCDIELQADTKIKEKEIRDYLKPQLQAFEIPRMMKFVDAIELTRTGKISKVGKL